MSDHTGASGAPDDVSEQPSVDATAEGSVEDENARLRAELAETKEQLALTRSTKRRRIRGILTIFLVVLTSVAVLASTVSFWAHRTVFDTDHYVALVGPLAQDPKVTTALSDYLTNQVVQAVDVEDRVTNALGQIQPLPAQAVPLLAGAIATAATNEIRQVTTSFLQSQAFQDLWVRVNTVGHEKIVALLRGDYSQLPNISIRGAEVNLNLIPIISQVLRQLLQKGLGLVGANVTIPDISVQEIPEAARNRLSQALGVSLPADFGQVTIMSQQKLSAIQTGVRRFDRLVWALIGLAIVLIAATILVAVNRRRAVVQLGIGIGVALILTAILVRRLQSHVLQGIKSSENRDAARSVLTTTLHSLRSVGLVVLIVAIIAAIVAYLAGKPSWVMRALAWARAGLVDRTGDTAARRWVVGHADGLRIGGIAVALVVLVFTGIAWIPVLIVGILLALFLWALAVLEQAEGPTEPGGAVPAAEAGSERTAPPP